MVTLKEMVEAAIARARRAVKDAPPMWAVALANKLNQIDNRLSQIERKVAISMALDTAVLHRILAGGGALVEAVRAGAEREKALQAKLDSVSGELASERAAELVEDEADAKANADALALADAMDNLLKGPETPTVEVPVAEDAPAVVEGSQEPVVTDEGPAADADPAADAAVGDNTGEAVSPEPVATDATVADEANPESDPNRNA
jgi:hypothetical protein